jgi:hypothetical protein
MAVKQSLSVLQPMGYRRFRSVWRVAVSSFAPFAGFGTVDEDMVYAKLSVMVEDAHLASDRLWPI